jgi:hypothetical protein
MIPHDEAEAFWAVTVDCLVEFHRLAPEEADARVASLRERLARSGARTMVYHAEPFDVACDLAGVELDRTPVEMEYERMLAGSGGAAGRSATLREPRAEYRPES